MEMSNTATKMHEDQNEVKVLTVTLPNGKTMAFQYHSTQNKVYASGTTQYWTKSEFAKALEKMQAAGATVVESVGYAFE